VADFRVSQEKPTECAGMSAMMVKDIEGCRTWASASETTTCNLLLKMVEKLKKE